MWTTGCASARSGAATGEAPPRPPARLCVLLDLRLRRRTIAALVVVIASGVILGLRGRNGGTSPRSAGSSTASTSGPLSSSSSRWSSTSGKVLHGRLARRARPHLGDRRDRLPGRDRRRLHRLPLPAELRLTVDRQLGQGRAELGRDRLLLQRRRLRPDVHVPRHPSAAPVVALVVWHVLLVRRHGVVPPYPAKAAKPAAPPAATGDAERGDRAVSPQPPSASRRRRALAGPLRPLRPGQGARRGPRGHGWAGGAPHHPLLLPRRLADDDPEFGKCRSRRLLTPRSPS